MLQSLAFTLGGLWLAALGLPESREHVLREIRQEQHPHETHIVLVGPSDYDYRSPDPRTIIIDLVGWAMAPTSEFKPTSPAIASVTMSLRREGQAAPTASVTIHLVSEVPYRVESQGNTVRLIIQDAVAAQAQAQATGTAVVAAISPMPTATVASIATATVPTPVATAAPPAETLTAQPEVAAVAAASHLIGVTSEDRQGRIAIVARFDGRPVHKAFQLGSPERLVVDFPEVRLSSRSKPPAITAGVVRGVRVSQFSVTPRSLRVVVDLESRVPYEIVDEGSTVTILIGARPAS